MNRNADKQIEDIVEAELIPTPDAVVLQTTEIIEPTVVAAPPIIEAPAIVEAATEQPTQVIVGAVPAAQPLPAPVIQPQIDISKIAPRLYVGSAPVDLAYPYTGFSMIVLCAEEYQPELPAFQGKLVRCGFNDTDKPTREDLETAARATEEVYAELVARGRVLVTCAAGRNRSCLVAGMVLGRRLPAADVIAAIRAGRGKEALSNPVFRQLVEVCAVKTVSVARRTQLMPAGFTKVAAPAPFAPPAAPARPAKKKNAILGFIFGQKRPPGPARVGTGRGYYGRARVRGAR